ncbi:MAG: hypothetical protein FE834_04670 [Gammaproteobacteria bacterium]|nr:hypothetical protein [Gammaproteobacteria bacterium]
MHLNFTKILLLSMGFSLANITFAKNEYSAQVKGGDVNLKINSTLMQYKQDEMFDLSSSDTVCYLKGGGKVVIEYEGNYYTNISKNSNCKTLPFVKKESNGIFAYLFGNTNHKEVSGISGKSLDNYKINTMGFKIPKDVDFISLKEVKTITPFKLQIFDEKSRLKSEKIIKNRDFSIPVNSLKNDYKIKIFNPFSDLVLDVVVNI